MSFSPSSSDRSSLKFSSSSTTLGQVSVEPTLSMDSRAAPSSTISSSYICISSSLWQFILFSPWFHRQSPVLPPCSSRRALSLFCHVSLANLSLPLPAFPFFCLPLSCSLSWKYLFLVPCLWPLVLPTNVHPWFPDCLFHTILLHLDCAIPFARFSIFHLFRTFPWLELVVISLLSVYKIKFFSSSSFPRKASQAASVSVLSVVTMFAV